jgi:hypothetical protein
MRIYIYIYTPYILTYVHTYTGLNADGTRCLRVHTSGQYVSSITLPVPLSTSTDTNTNTSNDIEQGNSGIVHNSGGCSSGTRSRRVSSGEKSSLRLFM